MPGETENPKETPKSETPEPKETPKSETPEPKTVKWVAPDGQIFEIDEAQQEVLRRKGYEALVREQSEANKPKAKAKDDIEDDPEEDEPINKLTKMVNELNEKLTRKEREELQRDYMKRIDNELSVEQEKHELTKSNTKIAGKVKQLVLNRLAADTTGKAKIADLYKEEVDELSELTKGEREGYFRTKVEDSRRTKVPKGASGTPSAEPEKDFKADDLGKGNVRKRAAERLRLAVKEGRFS